MIASERRDHRAALRAAARRIAPGWRPLGSSWLLILALGLLAGCGRGGGRDAAAPPNVLLITVDTLRPDALGWIGGQNETPAIDRLAREGFAFPAAVAPVPLTLPSHTSLMTGLNPPRHGVRDNGQIVPATLTTLASRLREHGYHTAAFVSGFTLKSEFGLDHGFDHYDDHLAEGVEGWLERRAAETTAAALAHLQQAPEPWFLWVHYYDPHDPYAPPGAFVRPGPRGAYDGEVAYTDAAIARLRSGLEARAGHALITVFTSDHGESLGEHEENGHGVFIYDTTVVVPLVFHAPGRIDAGRGAWSPRLIDVAPTLLGLLGLPPLPDADGVALGPALAVRPPDPPPAYVESRMSSIAYGWAPLSGWREEGWKYIQAPRPELYDLRADPGESVNLYETESARARRMARQLRDAMPAATAASQSVEDPELLERLRALGYLGAGRREVAVPDDAPDPKDRSEERRLLEVAEGHLRAGEFERALRLFEEVLRREPDNRFANLRAGIAHLKAGDPEAAIPRLRHSVRLDPEQAESRFALADALSRTGRVDEAIEQWLETVRLQPRRVAGWANLGTLLARAAQPARAREALARAFALDPDHAGILASIVILDRSLGTAAETVAMLQATAAERGPEFRHHAALGLLLVGTGDMAEARPWLEQARPGQHGFAEARWQLAIILAYRGELEPARAALAEAIRADPRIRERAAAHPLTRTWTVRE